MKLIAKVSQPWQDSVNFSVSHISRCALGRKCLSLNSISAKPFTCFLVPEDDVDQDRAVCFDFPLAYPLSITFADFSIKSFGVLTL